MEGLQVSNANLVVYLHPSKSKRVSEAILRELSSLLFKYNESFDGVVLAYDPKFRSNAAKILTGIHPYFGMTLDVRLLLFNPKPEMLVEGEVVKISQQSVHMIVLGFSSAIVTEEDVRDEFKFKLKDGKEMFISKYHKKHKIEVGNIVRFSVKSFDEEILHISGSLIPAHTGNVQWLEKNVAEWSQADSTGRNRKRSEKTGNMLEHDEEMIDGKIHTPGTDNPTKKSKRRKSGNT